MQTNLRFNQFDSDLGRLEKAFSPISRLALSGIFISAGISKFRDFEMSAQYAKSKKIPFEKAAIVAAGVVEVAGGLSMLLGYKTKLTSAALAAYLVPVSAIFHDFWRVEGQEKQMQQINFFKNLGLIGGLLKYASQGAGSISLDQRLRSARRHGRSSFIDSLIYYASLPRAQENSRVSSRRSSKKRRSATRAAALPKATTTRSGHVARH